jgi:hypothetical protein
MLFTIRVAFAVIFSAFALWSQTTDADKTTLNVSLAGNPAIVSSQAGDPPPAFKLHMPQPNTEIFVVAGNSTSPFPAQTASAPASPRPKAFNYSNGYFVRQKVHKYASLATLSLFVSEAIVGQKLYDRTTSQSDSLRSAHSALAAGIGVLFGVNSVTGIWNMWEARKDPNGRTKRLVHGMLMLAADAGFVATAASAPHRERNGVQNNDPSTHRAVAFSSLGVATVGYVYMLLAR